MIVQTSPISSSFFARAVEIISASESEGLEERRDEMSLRSVTACSRSLSLRRVLRPEEEEEEKDSG